MTTQLQESHFDLLQVQDHQLTITNQIRQGENSKQIEEYISKVEEVFQAILIEERILLAIATSSYNLNKLPKSL